MDLDLTLLDIIDIPTIWKLAWSQLPETTSWKLQTNFSQKCGTLDYSHSSGNFQKFQFLEVFALLKHVMTEIPDKAVKSAHMAQVNPESYC